MNFLAHAVLAGSDRWLQLGGFLGDFVHGALPPEWPPALQQGVRLHRAIDRFTDQHPAVIAARADFEPPYRRFAGIALDLWFDHCLAIDFQRWTQQSLDTYSRQLQQLLLSHDAWLTPALRRFRSYMLQHQLPAGYADLEQFEQVLAGVSQRLRFANPIATMLPQLQAREALLAQVFARLFADLTNFAVAWREAQPDRSVSRS